MKTSVLVTAVSGTGKSTVCRALQDLGHTALDIESIDGLYELVDEATGAIVPGGLDQIRQGVNWNCNKAKLQELLATQQPGVTFYCGGMANTDEVWDVFNSIIVLVVSDTTTTLRLSTRPPGEFGSLQSNREWVLSWKHEIEDGWLAAGGIAVEAEAEPDEVARALAAAIGT